MKSHVKWLALLAPVLVLSALAWVVWPVARDATYSVYRAYGKTRDLEALEGYQSIESRNFRLFYTKTDANVAEMILETAQDYYEPVVSRLGFRPPGKAVIIVYPDRATFRNAFGWGSEESALGVYHAGTIRLLSPNVWIKNRTVAEKRKAFRRLGPVSHEFSHYVLDYFTNGNYPRWFTEGLAQRVEFQITRYLWLEKESTLRQRLYSLKELEGNFDALPNQALAYRQSYLLVEFLVERYGEEQLQAVIQRLGSGERFEHAIKATTGVGMSVIYEAWERWVAENMTRLDLTP